MAAYANFNQQFNNFSGINCTQVKYSDYIAEYKDVRPWPQNENAAGRAWTYQTCTEFGYFQVFFHEKIIIKELLRLENLFINLFLQPFH